ncbi:MAG: TetR/AcrR family transcriptional regulator [Chloroflexota bacterium]|nr:TetR/AcrR family transcriptional regulator [Chloroflexota bacterium]
MKEDSLTAEKPRRDDGDGRSARRRARTRADLIAAARRVFAARGFHDASIADITAAADVAVGTFYVHFRDKDEALAVLLDEGLDGFRLHVAAAVQAAPLERAIPALIHATFHYAYHHRELFTILLTGAGLTHGLRARDELANALMRLLERVNGSSELATFNIPLLARMMSGVLAQGILWWSDHDDPTPDAMTAQALRLLRYGLPATLLGADDSGSSPSLIS